MLRPDEMEKSEHRFAESETGLLMEGLNPTSFGLSLRERVLTGEISLEQAEAELSAHYMADASKNT